MDLISIDDAAENAFVQSQIHSDALIGLTDREREGAWKWAADGRLTWCENSPQPSPVSYANWAAQYPDKLDWRVAGANA